MDAKYEIEKEQEVRIWIEEVVGEQLDPVKQERPPIDGIRRNAT